MKARVILPDLTLADRVAKLEEDLAEVSRVVRMLAELLVMEPAKKLETDAIVAATLEGA